MKVVRAVAAAVLMLVCVLTCDTGKPGCIKALGVLQQASLQKNEHVWVKQCSTGSK
jgi:hypothetical protein